MSEISLERVAEIRDGVPVVALQVESTVNVPQNIFKYKVSTTGVDTYHSVCTLDDLGTIGETRAGGVSFYRRSDALIRYSSLSEAIEGKSAVVEEIQALLDSYHEANTNFLGTDQIKLGAQ